MSGMIALLAGLGILLVFVLLICIAVWVFYALMHVRMLKAMNYDKPWMAWIPFANQYALADCLKLEEAELFGSVKIPMNIFKFWFAVPFVLSFVPVLGTLLSIAARVILGGFCYIKIYSKLDSASENDVMVLGYLSGWIPIIAAFKFMSLPK